MNILTSGNDVFKGSNSADAIDGANGDDSIDGGIGKDTILGGDGRDTLLGGQGEDSLVGGNGDDSISGDGDNDKIFGGSGNDTLNGDAGMDTVSGEDGNDTLRYSLEKYASASVVDQYSGGNNTDTLALYFTKPQWLDSVNQQAVTNARNSIATASPTSLVFTVGGHTQTLNIDGVEQLAIFVDDVAQNAANEAVTPGAHAYSMGRYSNQLTVYISELLKTDTVPDGVKSVALVSTTTPHGSVTTGPIQFIYTPDLSYFNHLQQGQTETDTFSYQITDADGSVGTANVVVTMAGINDSPVAHDDTASVASDEIANIHVLDNDVDVDDNSVMTVSTVTVVGGLGRAQPVGRDIVTFSPGTDFNYLTAGQSAQVTLHYTVRDQYSLKSNVADIVVTVHAPDAPPVGSDTTVGIVEDQGYVFQAADFSCIDADSPGAALQAVKLSELPAHGVLYYKNVAVSAGAEISVADIAAGRLTLVPEADFHGTSSFRFQVRDDAVWATLDTSPNTFTFTVAPGDQSFTSTIFPGDPYSSDPTDWYLDPNDLAAPLHGPNYNVSIKDMDAVSVYAAWASAASMVRFGDNLEITDDVNHIHWTILGQYTVGNPDTLVPSISFDDNGGIYPTALFQGNISNTEDDFALVGSSADDVLQGPMWGYGVFVGGAGNDLISGGAVGNDIWGQAGDDTVWTGDGDQIEGGAGSDAYIVSGTNFSFYVKDFTPGGSSDSDHIRLAAGAFPDVQFDADGSVKSADFLAIENASSGTHWSNVVYSGEHIVLSHAGNHYDVYYIPHDVTSTVADPYSSRQWLGRLDVASGTPQNSDFTRALVVSESGGYTFGLEDFGLGTHMPGHRSTGTDSVSFPDLPPSSAGTLMVGNLPYSFGSISLAAIEAGRLTFVPAADSVGEINFSYQVTSNVMHVNLHTTTFTTTFTDYAQSINVRPALHIQDAASYTLDDITETALIRDSGGANDAVHIVDYGDIRALNFVRYGDNLELTASGSADALHVILVDQYTTTGHVETLAFDDGGEFRPTGSGNPLGPGYSLGTDDFLLQSASTGGSSNEILAGSNAADSLSGGAGNDLLFGGLGADMLYGDSQDDFLAGGAGDDTLDGGDDNDYLTGGGGSDEYIGGDGYDVFVFDSRSSGDHITDFDIGFDLVFVDRSVFADALFNVDDLALGQLLEGQLMVVETDGTGLQNNVHGFALYSGEHFVFVRTDSDSGNLYYLSTDEAALSGTDVPVLTSANMIGTIDLVNDINLNYASFYAI